LCQQCCGKAVLRGAAGVETFRHGTEHFAQTDRLGRRKPESPSHALCIQPEQLANGSRRTENPRGSSYVPADIVMRRENCIADAALNLDAQDQRVNEINAGDESTT
jgi:hypothetical protein